jgi:cytochrome c peroxidase
LLCDDEEKKKIMLKVRCIALLFAGGASVLWGAAPTTVDLAQLKMFAPLPTGFAGSGSGPTAAQVDLGRMLYYETRLSKSQQISCNTCHLLDRYGVDGLATSDGHKKQKGDRNAPTVYNAAGHFTQFWDGRALDVEAQAKGPVLNPVEMAMPSEKHAVTVLKSMPEYVAAFKKAFPKDADPVTYDNMGKAIGAFERGLVTPSRWDKFLKGDQAALTSAEKIGVKAFLAAGCQNCHSGALLGGTMYQKLGLAKAYPDQSDAGRAKVTKAAADKMLFKVPSLRNVEKTGPYFHTGKVATLEQAVSEMAVYQGGKPLSADAARSIVVFLKALTGELPAGYIQCPKLPGSSASTPKADLSD